MYPFLKWATTVLRARRRPPLRPEDESVLECRVGLTDTDLFMELNHARYLHYMELGRWDYSQRVGFVRAMRAHKWGIAVGGASIRYRRRLPLFARFTLSTRLVCHDGRWIYFLQEVYSCRRICASALMKVGATSSEGLVPAPEVLEALGWDDVWGTCRTGLRPGPRPRGRDRGRRADSRAAHRHRSPMNGNPGTGQRWKA